MTSAWRWLWNASHARAHREITLNFLDRNNNITRSVSEAKQSKAGVQRISGWNSLSNVCLCALRISNLRVYRRLKPTPSQPAPLIALLLVVSSGKTNFLKPNDVSWLTFARYKVQTGTRACPTSSPNYRLLRLTYSMIRFKMFTLKFPPAVAVQANG